MRTPGALLSSLLLAAACGGPGFTPASGTEDNDADASSESGDEGDDSSDAADGGTGTEDDDTAANGNTDDDTANDSEDSDDDTASDEPDDSDIEDDDVLTLASCLAVFEAGSTSERRGHQRSRRRCC